MQRNGVNPGEGMTIIFNLINEKTFVETINALKYPTDDNDLRIGIHVQGFANGGSESSSHERQTKRTEFTHPHSHAARPHLSFPGSGLRRLDHSQAPDRLSLSLLAGPGSYDPGPSQILTARNEMQTRHEEAR